MAGDRPTTYGLRRPPPDSSREPAPDDITAWCSKIYERVKRHEREITEIEAGWRSDHETLIHLSSTIANYTKRISIMERQDSTQETVELAKIAHTVDSLQRWKRGTRGLFWGGVFALAGTVGTGIWQAGASEARTEELTRQVTELTLQVKSQTVDVRYARELAIEKSSVNNEAVRRLDLRLNKVETGVDKLTMTHRSRR